MSNSQNRSDVRVSPRLDKRGEHGPFDIIEMCTDVRRAVRAFGETGHTIEKAHTLIPTGGVVFSATCATGAAHVDVLRAVMAMVDAARRLCQATMTTSSCVLQQKCAARTACRIRLTSLRGSAAFAHGRLNSWQSGEHYILTAANSSSRSGDKGKSAGKRLKVCAQILHIRRYYGRVRRDRFPIRRDRANDYRGGLPLCMAHAPPWPVIKTTPGASIPCVFGGKLTALRYPEFELVSVRHT